MDHHLLCTYWAIFGNIKISNNDFTYQELIIEWTDLAPKDLCFVITGNYIEMS